MDRRRFLRAAGTAGTALLAGCGGGDGDGDGNGTTTDDGTTTATILSAETTTDDDSTSDLPELPKQDPEPLLENGPMADKADVLLVGKDYESDETMESDFRYFMDFDGNNRGLFDIPPFDEHRDKFNIWTKNANGYIYDYEDPPQHKGLIKDSFDIFELHPEMDYYCVLSKTGLGRNAFAYGNRNQCWVGKVHQSHELDVGAKGFLHEFGHSFGNLKDEYYSVGGPDRAGKPNCADSKEQAREWWGGLANESDEVGYYEGCAYNEENWRPHRKSIMGNGGKWSYGPVNERAIRDELSKYE